MAGKNDLEEARAAMIAETVEDFFISHIYKLFREEDKGKEVRLILVRCLKNTPLFKKKKLQ